MSFATASAPGTSNEHSYQKYPLFRELLSYYFMDQHGPGPLQYRSSTITLREAVLRMAHLDKYVVLSPWQRSLPDTHKDKNPCPRQGFEPAIPSSVRQRASALSK